MMPPRCSARGPRFLVSASWLLCRVWSRAGCFGSAAKLYGEIGPAFYGLRTTLLTLLLVALLRIKRPEHLKERDPAAFGYVDTVKVSNGQQAPNRLIIS
jgi:hypothetical protein